MNKNELMQYHDSGFFLLRTPLLPFDDFLYWTTQRDVSISAPERSVSDPSEERWARETASLRSTLRTLIRRPEIRLALSTASPSLDSSIDAWMLSPESKKGLQTERAVVRYFTRMATRSTPFGLLAGCSVGTIASENDEAIPLSLILESANEYRVYIEPDLSYLSTICRKSSEVPALDDERSYVVNSSLYRVGSEWHYLTRGVQTHPENHCLVKVKYDRTLRILLAKASRPIPLRELIAEVSVLHPRLQPDDIRSYIREVIKAEILLPEFTPPITGTSPLIVLAEQLGSSIKDRSCAASLMSAHEQIRGISVLGLNASRKDYEGALNNLHASLCELEEPISVPPISEAFSIELIKPLHAGSIPQVVCSEMLNALDVLSKCGFGVERENRVLDGFRSEFHERYGTAWIPLLQSLDSDTGIQIGTGAASTVSPIVQSLLKNTQRNRPQKPLSYIYENLFSILTESLHGGSSEISLDPARFPRTVTKAYSLPGAFALTVTLLTKSLQTASAGDFTLFLHAGGGPSGAITLGRFCCADKALEERVRTHLREEEALDPDVLHAEVVYTPETRDANLARRPTLREYEIPYMGRSGVPDANQIKPKDLLVTVRDDGEIILFSPKLQKRIVPRLTSAAVFNDPRFPAVYRFLCYLQYEPSTAIPMFSWGPLDGAFFLPRVKVGKTVVSPARWNLTRTQVQKISDMPTQYRSFCAVQHLRESIGLPRFISAREKDNSLLIDLDNPMSVDSLVQLINRQEGSFGIQEGYVDPEMLCVRDNAGRFCHEFVVPFVRAQNCKPTLTMEKSKDYRAFRRPRGATSLLENPERKWLYTKIYTGIDALDTIIAKVLPIIVRTAIGNGLIGRWFFIRYADPHPHLRLRMELREDSCLAETKTLIEKHLLPLERGRIVWKVSNEPYKREVERYGGREAIEVAEEIFCADSAAVMSALKLMNQTGDQNERWKLGLLSSHLLFYHGIKDIEQRIQTVDRNTRGFFGEFALHKNERDRIAKRYKENRDAIEALVNFDKAKSQCPSEVWASFEIRSRRVVPLIDKLRQLEVDGRLTNSIAGIVSSLVHMSVNRCMRDEQRLHEMVFYDFLRRAYRGVQAREISGTSRS